jgi:hypothetical protein
MEIKGADFSEDGLYRYSLWRVWDESKPLAMFIGLNPSQANAEKDDNTIKRVRAIATNLGYGGIYMCNCFSYISTNPKFLQAETIEAMMKNAEVLKLVASRCKDVFFAWGNFKVVSKSGIDKKLLEAFPNAKALFINQNGSPKHPLFCRTNIQPVSFQGSTEWVSVKERLPGEDGIFWKVRVKNKNKANGIYLYDSAQYKDGMWHKSETWENVTDWLPQPETKI